MLLLHLTGLVILVSCSYFPLSYMPPSVIHLTDAELPTIYLPHETDATVEHREQTLASKPQMQNN